MAYTVLQPNKIPFRAPCVRLITDSSDSFLHGHMVIWSYGHSALLRIRKKSYHRRTHRQSNADFSVGTLAQSTKPLVQPQLRLASARRCVLTRYHGGPGWSHASDFSVDPLRPPLPIEAKWLLTHACVSIQFAWLSHVGRFQLSPTVAIGFIITSP